MTSTLAIRYIHALTLTAVALAGISCKRRQVDSAVQAADPVRRSTANAPYHRYGIRPDCTEEPFTFESLQRQAATASNQQQLLERIPRGSLQTFTLIFKSESAQKEGISKEYPGVIRMSANGKLVIRYTCDPNSPVYNTVETIHFDDATKKFQFAEFDFRETKHDGDCAACHDPGDDTPDDMRPNWNMYDTWPGVFGSRDDFFPPASRAEQQDFDRFLATRKNDPCYQTLPWPVTARGETLPATYARYPYGTVERNTDYALRPNLKFTEVLSHLLAVRNFHRLKNHPSYESVKRLLAFESAYCPNARSDLFRRNLQRQVPTIVFPTTEQIDPPSFPASPAAKIYSHEPRHALSRAVGLFSTSLAIGFSPGDWTLTYDKPDKSGYLTGISPGEAMTFSFDLPISALVQTEILKDAVATIPSLRAFSNAFTVSRGESFVFGEQFACIDDLGGGLVFNRPIEQTRLCAALESEVNTYMQNPPETVSTPSNAPQGIRLKLGTYRSTRSDSDSEMRIEESDGQRIVVTAQHSGSYRFVYRCAASGICTEVVNGRTASTITPDNATQLRYSAAGEPANPWIWARD